MFSQVIRDLFLEPLKKPSFEKQAERVCLYHHHFLREANSSTHQEKAQITDNTKKRKRKKKKKIETKVSPLSHVNFIEPTLEQKILETEDPGLKLPARKVEKAHKWPTLSKINRKLNTPVVADPEELTITNTLRKNPEKEHKWPVKSGKVNVKDSSSVERNVGECITTTIDQSPKKLTPSNLLIVSGKKSVNTENARFDLLSSLLPEQPRETANKLVMDTEKNNEKEAAKFAPFKKTLRTIPKECLESNAFTPNDQLHKVAKLSKHDITKKKTIFNEPLPPGVDSLSRESSRSSSPFSDKVYEEEPLPPGVTPSPEEQSQNLPSRFNTNSTIEPSGTDNINNLPLVVETNEELLSPGVKSIDSHDLFIKVDSNETYPPGLEPPGMESDFTLEKKQNLLRGSMKTDNYARKESNNLTDDNGLFGNLSFKNRSHYYGTPSLDEGRFNKSYNLCSAQSRTQMKTNQPAKRITRASTRSSRKDSLPTNTINGNIVEKADDDDDDNIRLIDLIGKDSAVDISVMSTEQIKRKIQNPEELNKERKKRKKHKTPKEIEASRNWRKQRQVEIERQNEMKRLDKLKPCPYYQKKGECNYGDNCRFSHNVVLEKRMECCRYYISGACLKGNQCMFLHSEWPCKFFHLRNYCATGEKCPFSHAKITNEEIQKAFDARIEYEQTMREMEPTPLTTSTEPTVSDTTFLPTLTFGEKPETETRNHSELEKEETSHEGCQQSSFEKTEYKFPSLYCEPR